MMNYSKIIIEGQEHILCHRDNGTTFAFINVESTDAPEREEYLEWVAEGNEAPVRGAR
jgi:hypothetical protein